MSISVLAKLRHLFELETRVFRDVSLKCREPRRGIGSTHDIT